MIRLKQLIAESEIDTKVRLLIRLYNRIQKDSRGMEPAAAMNLAAKTAKVSPIYDRVVWDNFYSYILHQIMGE